MKTRTGDGFGGVEQAVTHRRRYDGCSRLAGLWLAGQDQRWAQIRLDVVRVRIGHRANQVLHIRGIG